MQGKNKLFRWDLSNCFESAVGQHGLPDVLWQDQLELAAAALLPRMAEERGGELSFRAIVHDSSMLRQVRSMADKKGREWKNLLVLGIGGSALGITAMETALGDPQPLLSEGKTRLFVCDSPDPERIAPLLERLDLSNTLINVISKSGGTVETMAQFLVFKEALMKQVGNGYSRHLVITTDPEKGALRDIARRDNLDTLDFPREVQGRYSVLTPMGLFAAELMGWGPEGLLEGAAYADEVCSLPAQENPALQIAVLLRLLTIEKEKRLAVMFPYIQALKDFADWWRQIWAESLGKEKSLSGETVFAGQTPLISQGPIDQHSQLQLWLEGPNDKVIGFVEVEKFRRDLVIPDTEKDGELGYLAGHSLSRLMAVEAEATRKSLTAHQRPNMTVEIPEVSAQTLGYLFMLQEIATVMAGYLWEVDPLNQPAVEESKVFMYQALGRPGY